MGAATVRANTGEYVSVRAFGITVGVDAGRDGEQQFSCNLRVREARRLAHYLLEASEEADPEDEILL